MDSSQDQTRQRAPLHLRPRLPDHIKAALEAKWLVENAEAIKAKNAWFEKHGLPLARYRMF
jgi:post-segregation antitoxin (ccd killing protein)